MIVELKTLVKLEGMFLNNIIYWTWCLPQSILGAIIYLIVKIIDKDLEEFRYKTGVWLVRTEKLGGGVSLGYFIFSFDYEDDAENKNTKMTQWRIDAQKRFDNHEWGHTIQGFIFGPLYLLIIGIPSILWAILGRNYRKKNNISYYSFYTEKWADKIGKVKR